MRKPYVIRETRSRYRCLTCKAAMRSYREVLKHECPPEPEQSSQAAAIDAAPF